MGLWTVYGGQRLYGTVTVQGSRNAALPILAACLVHKGVTQLEGVPRIGDVRQMLELLRQLGCRARQEGETVYIDSRQAQPAPLESSMTTGFREALLLLGAMAARFGQGSVPMPESGTLGPRPMDLHLYALEHLGAQVRLGDDDIQLLPGTLTGGALHLPYPAVSATAQAMLAACGAQGETRITGWAMSPELRELARYLTVIGHEITVTDDGTMTITPGGHTRPVRFRLCPDGETAAMLLCATAACGGMLTIGEVFSADLQPTLDLLQEMGSNIKIGERSVTLQSDGRLWSPGHPVTAGSWPMLPKSHLPPVMAACLTADGVSVFRETVPTGILLWAKQLRAFGGDVSLTADCAAAITGVNGLRGCAIRSRELRTGCGLLTAALQASGETTIVDDGVISRGCGRLDSLLGLLGARIYYTE